MRKWLSLLLMLSILMLTAACSTNTTGKDSDVLVQVGDRKITRAQSKPVMDSMLKQMTAMYGIDPANAEVANSINETALTLLGEGLALEIALDKLGAGISDADETQIEQQANSTYAAFLKSYQDAYGSTEEEARKGVDEQGYTLEAARFFARMDIIDMKLRDTLDLSVTVTDEEVVEAFDEAVLDAQERYAQDFTQYTADIMRGDLIVYRPEGYRSIQNLVIGLPEEYDVQVKEKANQLASISYEQSMIQNDIISMGDQLTEELLQEGQGLLDELQTQLDTLLAEIDTISAEGREKVREQADAILAAAKAPDADFDALMAQHNIDTATGELVTEGYPVCEGNASYVQSFTDGSMALANIGDISDLVESEYGFHILKYKADVTPGPVPLDELREEINAILASQKESEAYEAQRQKLCDDAGIETFPNKL